MKKYLKEGHDEVKARQQDITRHAGGRPRVITDEMKAGMLTIIRNGMTPREACMAMGVSEEWIKTEMKRYPEFAIDVQKAIENFKLFHLNNIQKHAKNTWMASAWLLERSFPERFNARVAQELISAGKQKEEPTWFGRALGDGATEVEYQEVKEEEEKEEVKKPITYIGQKLTEEEVKRIRREYKRDKIPYSVLADQYKVSKNTISDIINRKRYKHVE